MTTEPYSPAFPIDAEVNVNRDTEHLGITKREHFASMAMQGLLANETTQGPGNRIAIAALAAADALIAALNEVKP